jgi:hypothetical protein
MPGDGEQGLGLADDFVDGGCADLEQGGEHGAGQGEAPGQQGDGDAVFEGEDGFAPGPRRGLPGGAAALVQGGLALGVAGDSDLSGQGVPLPGRSARSGRDLSASCGPGGAGPECRGW